MWNSDHSYYLTHKSAMGINERMLVKAWKMVEGQWGRKTIISTLC